MSQMLWSHDCLDEKVINQRPKKNLNKARETFKKCGAEGWVKKYEKELATLS